MKRYAISELLQPSGQRLMRLYRASFPGAPDAVWIGRVALLGNPEEAYILDWLKSTHEFIETTVDEQALAQLTGLRL